MRLVCRFFNDFVADRFYVGNVDFFALVVAKNSTAMIFRVFWKDRPNLSAVFVWSAKALCVGTVSSSCSVVAVPIVVATASRILRLIS
jgi:hypothetical protein